MATTRHTKVVTMSHGQVATVDYTRLNLCLKFGEHTTWSVNRSSPEELDDLLALITECASTHENAKVVKIEYFQEVVDEKADAGPKAAN